MAANANARQTLQLAPPITCAAAEPRQDVALLDVEFFNYLQLAQELMKRMTLAEDRKVADKYVRNCIKMKDSDQLNVKLHRNRFFRYLLKTMKRTAESQVAHFVNLPEGVQLDEDKSFTQWSADGKSYVSAKVIPGYGTLIYMACTDKPELGWDDNGFAGFQNILEIPYETPEGQPAYMDQSGVQRPSFGADGNQSNEGYGNISEARGGG